MRGDEEGQGLAEYALILALIAIIAIVSPDLPRQPDRDKLSTIGNAI